MYRNLGCFMSRKILCFDYICLMMRDRSVVFFKMKVGKVNQYF